MSGSLGSTQIVFPTGSQASRLWRATSSILLHGQHKRKFGVAAPTNTCIQRNDIASQLMAPIMVPYHAISHMIPTSELETQGTLGKETTVTKSKPQLLTNTCEPVPLNCPKAVNTLICKAARVLVLLESLPYPPRRWMPHFPTSLLRRAILPCHRIEASQFVGCRTSRTNTRDPQPLQLLPSLQAHDQLGRPDSWTAVEIPLLHSSMVHFAHESQLASVVSLTYSPHDSCPSAFAV